MSQRTERWIAALLLLALFGLQVTSARLKSPTYDEQVYISRGYAFVRLRDLHILVGEPVLLNALNALPLLGLPGVRLPVDDPAWAGTNFHPIAEAFMWQVNPNADQILFLARVPTMLLTLLLAVFVYRWAREAFGRWAGLLALLLCALDPNLIAHGQLAATDLGSTALIFIATYFLWRLLRCPSWRNLVWSGVFFGLAQASRFSALLFAPGYALIFALRLFSSAPFDWPWRQSAARVSDSPVMQSWRQRLLRLFLTGILVLLIGYFTMWAAHGFQFGPVQGYTTWAVPAPSYFEQLLYIQDRLSGSKDPVTGFLLGKLYVGGDWRYFPVVLALKTPLPTLILLLGAVVLLVVERKKANHTPVALWLLPLIYFAITLNSKLNLGYRYILPMLPFVIVLASRCAEWAVERIAGLTGSRRALATSLAALTVGWTVWSGIDIYPHYLAYFNELAGGPDNGWRYLVDSNIDWGQDLKLLKRWMDEQDVQTIKLAYYGEGIPSYYGINFDPQICAPDRWQHPLHHDLYPGDPAPGVYAISANLLQGRNLADPDSYRWFREHEPIDKVGYSIFIYEVPRRGERVTLTLSGLTPADIQPEDYALLNTNDVRVLWFDAGRSLVFPAGESLIWLVGGEPHPALSRWIGSPIREISIRDGRPAQVFNSALQSNVINYINSLDSAITLPVRVGPVELIGYQWEPANASPGETAPGAELTLVTYWRVVEPVTEPLTLFVHLLDAEGANRAGEDRGDLWYDNWQIGDLFAQVQEIPLPADLSIGHYAVEIGWYASRTLIRLPVLENAQSVADRVLIGSLEVR
ncbi:MAG: glycosyltransferase family 39 protein [Anaerolineae bacterium]|nr:glycosyltransferase family 39 protein [Anaerolineae bacterium]